MLPKPYYEREGVRIFCGDSRVIVPQLGGGFESVATDPPYGMEFVSNHRTIKHDAIANDGCDSLLRFACEIPADHSKYIFMRWDNIAAIPKPTSLITWVKNNWSMGDLDHEHARQTECIAFYRGVEHSWPGQRPTDVISWPRTDNEFHPTEKPVGLIQRVIALTFGTILDPFLGSGTTAVACIRTGRKCIGIELEEKYCEIAAKRCEAEFGRTALIDPVMKFEQKEMFE